jgi:hypothetical protein
MTGSGGSGDSTFAYVSAASSQGSYEIDAFAVSADGALTPVSGSPFTTKGYGPLSMTADNSMLFGADGYSVYSFSIASDGALQPAQSFAAGYLSRSAPPEPTGGPINLFFDGSRSTLYDGFANLDGTENNGYQALRFTASGVIGLIGNQGASPALDGVLAFSGNNQFAFTSSCYHGTPMISAFSRSSSGDLTALSGAGFSAMPAAPSGEGYCPLGAAADTSNHLVVSVGITPPDDQPTTGPWQLATYTIGASGSVSTTSTSSTMPTTSVGQPLSYRLSPDDQYLAVGGQSGLQVFAYNASSGTISTLAGSSVLTSDNISQVSWDSAGHLYALSSQAGALYVYSVNASAVSAASGSPYSIGGASALAVN